MSDAAYGLVRGIRVRRTSYVKIGRAGLLETTNIRRRDPGDTRMKLISSIVRPEKVDVIRAALYRINVFGLTVAQVHDYAPQEHETTVWKGHEYTLGFCVKMAIDFVVHDDDVDEVVKLLICTARTGGAGDGFVSVLPVEHRYNIHSGEREVT